MSNGQNLDKQFLGAGISMNVAVDAQGQVTAMDLGLDENGNIRVNSYEDHVHQSILLIAQTAPGERMMRPDFGAGLSRLAFEPLGAATASLVRHQLTQALTLFEPRIDVLAVDVAMDPAAPLQLQISLSYRVRRTDTIFNMVFPYFLERGGL
jgi:phage baseplate assembly protein W